MSRREVCLHRFVFFSLKSSLSTKDFVSSYRCFVYQRLIYVTTVYKLSTTISTSLFSQLSAEGPNITQILGTSIDPPQMKLFIPAMHIHIYWLKANNLTGSELKI